MALPRRRIAFKGDSHVVRLPHGVLAGTLADLRGGGLRLLWPGALLDDQRRLPRLLRGDDPPEETRNNRCFRFSISNERPAEKNRLKRAYYCQKYQCMGSLEAIF